MLGDKLKELRTTKGFTQAQMAKIINISRTGYANWEQNHTEPSSADIKKICVLFDISADEFLGIETQEQRRQVNINNSAINVSGRNNKIHF